MIITDRQERLSRSADNQMNEIKMENSRKKNKVVRDKNQNQLDAIDGTEWN